MGVAMMANKAMLFVTFVDRAKRFEAHSSQFFAVFNRLVTLTSCFDAYMLRSGDFCGNSDNRKTDYSTPAHARGVISRTKMYINKSSRDNNR